MRAFFLYLISTVLSVSQAFAGLPPTTAKGQAETGKAVTFNFEAPNNQFTTTGAATRLIETGNKNLLKNPSFQDPIPANGWETNASASRVYSNDTSVLFEGKQSLKLTLTSSSEFIDQAVVPTAYLTGVNMEASIRLKTSLPGVKVCVIVGPNSYPCTDVQPNNVFAKYQVFFPGAAAGVTYRLRIEIPVSTGTINFADAYFGPAKSIAYGTPPNTFYASISSAGVVTDEQNGDWINGNCGVASNVFTCTFSSGFFNETPYCFGNGYNGLAGSNLDFVVSSTQMQIRPALGSTAGVLPMKVTCTKKGSDYVQPAVTAQNWNYPPRAYTPTITAAGTVSAVSFTESRSGAYLRVNFSFNAGTVTSGNVTLTLPSGMTANVPAARVIGSWNSQGSVGGGPLVVSPNSNLVVFSVGTNWQVPLTGNLLGSASIVTGFFEVPIIENGVPWQETWNALQLNGSVVADTNVKADKAAGITSIDYGTYSTTVTGVSNVSSVNSPGNCTFTRIGSVVRGSCSVRFQCTSGSGTTTQVDFTLPVPTTLATSTFRGTVGSGTVNETGYAVGTATNQGQIVLKCQYTAAPDSRIVSFEYQVP